MKMQIPGLCSSPTGSSALSGCTLESAFYTGARAVRGPGKFENNRFTPGRTAISPSQRWLGSDATEPSPFR